MKIQPNPMMICAIKEIEEILQRYDLAGFVALANGEGNGEMLNRFDPPWSGITVEDAPDGKRALRIRVKLKSGPPSERIKGNRTVNMAYVMREMVTDAFGMYDKAISILNQHMDIEVGSSSFTARPRDK